MWKFFCEDFQERKQEEESKITQRMREEIHGRKTQRERVKVAKEQMEKQGGRQRQRTKRGTG